MERSVGKPHCPCQDCLARIIHNQRGKRAWFKLLGTKVTLCFAELPVSFAANGCGSSGCAKKDAPLCLTKCYPAVNQAGKRGMVDDTSDWAGVCTGAGAEWSSLAKTEAAPCGVLPRVAGLDAGAAAGANAPLATVVRARERSRF